MNSRNMTARAAAGFFVLGGMLWAQSPAARPAPPRSSGAFSIWPGQVARLQVGNLVLTANTPTPVMPERSCSVQVRFIDGSGRTLKSVTLSVPGAQTRAAEFTPLEASLNSRVTLRVETQSVLPATTPGPNVCNTLSTVEVVDPDGRTRFVLEQSATVLSLPAASSGQ